MNRLLLSVFLFITISVIGYSFAQPSKYNERSTKQSGVIALQTPYNWFAYVNVASANYAVPDSVTIIEIRSLDSCRVKVHTWNNGTTDTLHFIARGDFYKIQVDTIYRLGTDSLSRTKRIFIGGMIR